MYKTLRLIFFFLGAYCQLSGQIFPNEATELNYRLIGFSFPLSPHASDYTIQVAAGNYYSEDSFKKSIILSRPVNTNKIIAEVPSFGKQYTWRVKYTTGNSSKTKETGLYHFSTGSIPAVDTSLNRLRITVPAKQYKDACIFNDGSGVLYNMSGQPIWYLPANKGYEVNNVRDLKLSPSGTITFVGDPQIYEVDYNGNILLKKPGGSISKTPDKHNMSYHHEFTKLSNGHYFALGSEELLCKIPSSKDSPVLIITGDKIKKDNNTAYQALSFGVLNEYDEKGNLVWTWHTSKYIMGSDLLYDGLYNDIIQLHDNSFYFDELNKTIYISFKGVSRVIKIRYPEGDILNEYGNKYKTGVTNKFKPGIADENGNDFFCGQHSCRRSQKGYLYLYNNNTTCPPYLPKIVIMQEPEPGKSDLKKVWEYDCLKNETDKDFSSLPVSIRTGGNVIELPDQSMFVSTGNILSKVFIVNLDKEILWSARSETWDKYHEKWTDLPSYRANIIPSRKDMEQLIWNSEK